MKIFFPKHGFLRCTHAPKSPLLCTSHTNSLSPPHINLYVYKASMINKQTMERERKRGYNTSVFENEKKSQKHKYRMPS